MRSRVRNIYLILFVLFITISCSPEMNSGERDLTVFRYNESKGIATLDPAYARNQTIIWPVSQVFNGLVQLDDSLKVIPSIAHSWEISSDGVQYIFHLRNNVEFHYSTIFSKNTRKVIADDFIYSFNRILDPSLA